MQSKIGSENKIFMLPSHGERASYNAIHNISYSSRWLNTYKLSLTDTLHKRPTNRHTIQYSLAISSWSALRGDNTARLNMACIQQLRVCIQNLALFSCMAQCHAVLSSYRKLKDKISQGSLPMLKLTLFLSPRVQFMLASYGLGTFSHVYGVD